MIRNYTIILLLLLNPSFGFAERLKNDAHDLQSILKPIQSYSARFIQTLQSDQTHRAEQFNGIVKLKKPHQFFWQIKTPDPVLIVCDGQQIWHYDQDLAQVTIQTWDQKTQEVPIFFLTGEIDQLEAIFRVKKLASNRFRLTPKDQDHPFEWIQLMFEKKQLVKLETLDQLGQRSQFIFKNIQVNQSIPDSLFHFSIPSGVDVIREAA